MSGESRLQLHLEPAEPIEVLELTNLLGSLSRQYQGFAVSEGIASKGSDARLLVSSVSPGSIDISFLPDAATIAGFAATALPVVVERVEVVTKFAEHIKRLLNVFLAPSSEAEPEEITVKDCDDAINIVKPIAEHGGHQTFNVIHGDVVFNVLETTVPQARKIMENASFRREELQFPDAEIVQRVSLVWTQLARDAAKTTGQKSPDKGIISDIDGRPRAVLFTDEMTYLKKEMIDDEQNPYKYVYFVDVVVSRVNGKIAAYRVAGYHGKEEMPD